MVENRERVVDCGKAVMFLIVCGDEILLQQRPDNGKGFANETIIPGGRGEEGESHRQIVKREVKEETGIDVGEKEVIVLGKDFKAITTNAHIYHMRAYLIVVESKCEVVNTSPNEGQHVWVPFSTTELEWAHNQLILERAEEFILLK